ncbi:hypothetical protein EDB85DRAFT_1903278 [Lactarius pseudohatsudake]|nr:hypothetical protein EDB85DRAFT_1903278 [Lactarius pseudohatsudake]
MWWHWQCWVTGLLPAPHSPALRLVLCYSTIITITLGWGYGSILPLITAALTSISTSNGHPSSSHSFIRMATSTRTLTIHARRFRLPTLQIYSSGRWDSATLLIYQRVDGGDKQTPQWTMRTARATCPHNSASCCVWVSVHTTRDNPGWSGNVTSGDLFGHLQCPSDQENALVICSTLQAREVVTTLYPQGHPAYKLLQRQCVFRLPSPRLFVRPKHQLTVYVQRMANAISLPNDYLLQMADPCSSSDPRHRPAL